MPVTQHTELSLDVPDTTTTTSLGARTQHHTFKSPQLERPHTGSLLVPGWDNNDNGAPTSTSTSTRSITWEHVSPQLEQTHTGSLIVPGHDDSTTSTPDVAYSPGTAHSQTSLQVPSSTVLAPIVVTAKSDTKLIVPTPRPGGNGGGNGNVATVSLPPEHGDGQGQGHGGRPPIRVPAHEGGQDGNGVGRPGQGQGPWEEFVSIVNEGEEGETGSGARPTEAPSQTGWSTYQFHEGASAATIDGTTYSLAPSGEGIYVDGQMTASATDSVAMAVMSALGGADEEDAGTSGSAPGSSTLATTTSSEVAASTEAGGSEASQGAAPQQTDSGAASLVLPGVGLGGVGVVMALL